jgi:hypothetical protein
MKAKLPEYKLMDSESLIKTGKEDDEISGEILWINPKEYDRLLSLVDNCGEVNANHPYKRFACEPITDEPIYRGIRPSAIKCWSYKLSS